MHQHAGFVIGLTLLHVSATVLYLHTKSCESPYPASHGLLAHRLLRLLRLLKLPELVTIVITQCESRYWYVAATGVMSGEHKPRFPCLSRDWLLTPSQCSSCLLC